MKNIRFAAVILLLAIALTGCGETYIKTTELPHYDYSDRETDDYNTKLFYANSYDIPLGDPAILPVQQDDGLWYYVTGTKSGSEFQMWRTKDFTNWEDVGTVYTRPGNFFGVKDCWAPQLMYDPEADWQYYLGSGAGEGKGLYLLCFSSRDKNGVCMVTATFSKKIDGPYQHFSGTDANGDKVDCSVSIFQMSKLKGLGLYADHPYGDLYKENRSFIDACPYIDPVTGEKYFYMVRSRNVDASNDVWGMKMKDWVTPDYSTVSPLSSYGFTTVEMEEKYNFTTKNKIDEGPFVYYKDDTDDGVNNGKYYLTLSIGDTNDKLYPVCQAIGDTPLGPFTKIQPEDGGLLSCPEIKVDIHGCGHHAFFEVGGELYIAYHTYEIVDERKNFLGSRYFAFDKVEWMYNDKGQYIMYSNGPTKNIQPLPAASSGYENIAPYAKVSASNVPEGSDPKWLNDKLIPHSEDDLVKEFFVSEAGTKVTFDFDGYVTARAVMVYNSYDFEKAFDKIVQIDFYYRKEIDGKTYTGKAVIYNVEFDFDANFIPEDYLKYNGERNLDQLRPCSAAIAEFNEIEVSRIDISIRKESSKEFVSVPEIVILGKAENK
ncbi:MAG: family 43 glycosylhydrolase [Clostridia bacterium]|nr:family 43 glycosylhydrolase [Clostridia bacterium]